MICRSELKRVQDHRDYPSLSLLAPTHRTAPAKQKDRIVVKNLAAEGLKRLRSEFKKREVAALVQNLNRLVARVDWEHSLEGLALFASREIATAVHLPFRLRASLSFLLSNSESLQSLGWERLMSRVSYPLTFFSFFP